VYADGLQCIRDPSQCSYICRDRESLRKRWQAQHNWSIRGKRGGSGRTKKEAVQRRLATGAKEVECQRFFGQGAHSPDFEVCRAADAPAEQVRPHTKFGTTQRIWILANEHAATNVSGGDSHYASSDTLIMQTSYCCVVVEFQ
jgi:hypothetical protein